MNPNSMEARKSAEECASGIGDEGLLLLGSCSCKANYGLRPVGYLRFSFSWACEELIFGS